MKWLRDSDVVAAEVTTGSLGVGFELGRAIEQKKKILCLYRPQEGKKLSAMIVGCKDLKLVEYQELDEAKEEIDKYFEVLD